MTSPNYLCPAPGDLSRPLLDSQDYSRLPPLHPQHLTYLAHQLPATQEEGYNSDTETSGSRQDDDDVYMATLDRKDQTDIDYAFLDAYLEQETCTIHSPSTAYRPRRLSTMADTRRYSLYGDRSKVRCTTRKIAHSDL
jgi:hypothetical protein